MKGSKSLRSSPNGNKDSAMTRRSQTALIVSINVGMAVVIATILLLVIPRRKAPEMDFEAEGEDVGPPSISRENPKSIVEKASSERIRFWYV
jgi:hypothetical protein